MPFSQRTIFVAVLLLMLSACDYIPFGYTPIGEINRTPGRYEGKEVKIRGVVTDISKLPFFEAKSYNLRDETGEITVFTKSTLPAMDETIAITAAVKTTAIVGNLSFGLRLEEIRRLPVYMFGK